jgi:hypothetical protein
MVATCQCPIHMYLITSDINLIRRETMKVKINEDWLATIIAFVLLILAMVNAINPAWVKF